MSKKLLFGPIVALIAGLFYLFGNGFLLGTETKSTPLIEVASSEQTRAITSSPEEQNGVASEGIPVLMYHSIGEEENNDAVITKQRFVEHMSYLQQHNYHPVSLADLLAYLNGKKPLPAKPVVITFDDGYRDTYEVVLPVLKQYAYKSTLFVPVGEVEQRLTWPELQEMKANGMEIASHSFHHRSLGDLSRAEQLEEIQRSKTLLDRSLNQETRYFCYPNGSYNQETLQLLKENGFVLAVITEPGWVKAGDELLLIRRIWMGNSVDILHFEERLNRAEYPIL